MNFRIFILSLVACATIGGKHANRFVTASTRDIDEYKDTKGLKLCETDINCNTFCYRGLFGCPPERVCQKGVCRLADYYEKCGKNVCNKKRGQACCDKNRGVCGQRKKGGILCLIPDRGSPPAPAPAPAPAPTGLVPVPVGWSPRIDDDEVDARCGPKKIVCGDGEYCCNESIGICAQFGAPCPRSAP